MDLLDNLKDLGGKKFEIQYDTQPFDRDTQYDDSDIEENTENTPTQSDHGAIFDKVKQKLGQLGQAEATDEDATQVVPKWDFSNSMLAQTQLIPKASVNSLPQLGLDEVEIEQDTQIESAPTQNYPESKPNGLQLSSEVPQNHETPATQAISLKEDRMAKIARLAEAKRQQRLAKEKEESEQQNDRESVNQQLLADISHTTLTDEEEDMLEANQSVVSSDIKNTSTKSLKEIEEFLQIQKRSRDLQPQFRKKNVFTAEDLLREFENEDAEQDGDQSEADSAMGLNNQNGSDSPITSPMKTKSGGKHIELDDDLNVHLTSDPISEYAHNLKTQLLSSPSKDDYNEPRMINLDSDDDEDPDLDAHNGKSHRNNISNNNKENHDISDLTKDEILHIKQKYLLKRMSNNPQSNFIHLPKNIRNSINNQQRHRESKILINNLQKANINQLQIHKKFNPLHDELIDMEKDEEVMGSLLERELERARTIRKKEKLLERAKAALLKGELNSENEGSANDEDVPESDFDQSFNEEDDEEDEEEDEDQSEEEASGGPDDADDADDFKYKRKSKRVILSDDDEFRKDDSYMFGAKSNDNEESLNAHHEGYITTGTGENIAPSTINEEIHVESQKYELFQNLKARSGSAISQAQKSDILDSEDTSHLKVPSFQDIASQRETQVVTQADATLSTQIDGQTQVILQNLLKGIEEEEDDDEITPANYRRGRLLVRKNNISEIEEDREEQGEGEEVEDERMINEKAQAEVKLYEQKMRRKELKLRKKRKEMERKGMKNIVHGEAEESEDEWHGLGGVDGEFSDEQANSEDEKMIDNNFNIDLNDDEVRQKFMEQYQIKDKKELEKLLDDIKNHKLTKRIGSNNGFDIELSDEEDELLSAYRKQRMMEQRLRLMENKKIQELAKNEKSRAFFTSIQDSTLAVNIDKEEEQKTDSEVESNADEDEESEKELVAELDTKKRKTIKLKESFVQKQLSFLTTMGNDDEEVEYFKQQRISDRQYGFGSDGEDVEDLQTMKRRCMESLIQGKNANSTGGSMIDISNDNSQKRADGEDTDADDDDEDHSGFFSSFKRPSLVKSFRSNNELEVGSFSGVTIRKQYKAASGAKASISGASSNLLRKGAAIKSSSLKEKRISRNVTNSRNGSGLFQSSGFDN